MRPAKDSRSESAAEVDLCALKLGIQPPKRVRVHGDAKRALSDEAADLSPRATMTVQED